MQWPRILFPRNHPKEDVTATLFSFEGTGYQVQGFIHPGSYASSSTGFHTRFMSLKTFQIFSD
jgi:hypothetical protein